MVNVAFRILPRRARWLIGRGEFKFIMLTPIRKPTLTRGRYGYHYFTHFFTGGGGLEHVLIINI